MKILFWVTHLNGEILNYLRYEHERKKHDLLLAYDRWERFQREACQNLWPLHVKVMTRRTLRDHLAIQRFGADVVVVDNHLPPLPVARKIFVIWHGYGWKGPQDRDEFSTFFRQCERLVGPIDQPNSHFLWKAYGPLDESQRIERMELPPSNIRQLGMAASDDFFVRTFDRAAVQPFYTVDVTRPTLLFAPTWHYDEVFHHWGGDAHMLPRLGEFVDRRGINLIVRMHDRKRYAHDTLKRVDVWAAAHPTVMLKYHDEWEDNTVDLMLADVLLTNFSSIANPYYASGKPSVHLYPLSPEVEQVQWRRLQTNGLNAQQTIHTRDLWKFPLSENGGDLAYTPEEMFAQLDAAFSHPQIHQERTRQFLDKYIYHCDGHTCERIGAFLEEWVERDATKIQLPPLTQLLRPCVLRGWAHTIQHAWNSRHKP